MSTRTFDQTKLQFEELLTSVGRVLAHENGIHIVQSKLRRHFNTASSTYLCSEEFHALFERVRSAFDKYEPSRRYFTLLSTLDQQLRKHPLPLRRRSQELPDASVQTPLASSIEVGRPVERNPAAHDYAPCFAKRERKIKKLQRQLSKLSKTIRKLEQEDMSLDEMRHCDLYQVESNLKKRALKVYHRLTQLQDQPQSVERLLDEPITLAELDLGYPTINQALEDMVNQTQYLPSFGDVLETVEKTASQERLHIDNDDLKKLAEKLFKLIGVKVKHRRMADFRDIMSSRLPEEFDIDHDDPALHSPALEEALVANGREAMARTASILERYSQMNTELVGEDSTAFSEDSAVENEDDDVHYDGADALPPLSPQWNTSPPPPVDDAIVILTTASLPLRTNTHGPPSPTCAVLDPTETPEPEITIFVEEPPASPPIARRRESNARRRTLYDYYPVQVRQTTSAVRSKNLHRSDAVEAQQEPEIISLE